MKLFGPESIRLPLNLKQTPFNNSGAEKERGFIVARNKSETHTNKCDILIITTPVIYAEKIHM